MVAQIDKQHTAMVADAMAPARQPNRLADMAVAERAAGMGPVTMHGNPEKAGGGSNRGAGLHPTRSVRVYPRLSGAATECARLSFLENDAKSVQKCRKNKRSLQPPAGNRLSNSQANLSSRL